MRALYSYGLVCRLRFVAEAAIDVVSAQGAASLFRIEDFISLFVRSFVFSPLSDHAALWRVGSVLTQCGQPEQHPPGLQCVSVRGEPSLPTKARVPFWYLVTEGWPMGEPPWACHVVACPWHWLLVFLNCVSWNKYSNVWSTRTHTFEG